MTSSRALVVAVLALAGCTITAPPADTIDAGALDAGPPRDDAAPPEDAGADRCAVPGETLGETCGSDLDCDDGCHCNGAERCVAAACVAGSDPCQPGDGIECTREVCDESLDACTRQPDDLRCDDGLACNGVERCEIARGCVSGSPLFCNDEDACTQDTCEDGVGCVYRPRDLDRDGFAAASCGGDDCLDEPPLGGSVHPGATEQCENRRDDDCDGRTDYADDACIATNDECASRRRIPETTAVHSATLRALDGDHPVSCARDPLMPDAVFVLTLTQTRDLRAAIGGAHSDAAIALRALDPGQPDACAAGPDLRCTRAPTPSLFHRALAPGDYAILVRSTNADTFDLRITLGEPTAPSRFDRCAPDTAPITASGSFTGLLEETTDDYTVSCASPAGGTDAVMRLVLTEARDVTLRASTDGLAGDASVALAIVGDCDDATTTRACQYVPRPRLVQTLPPGTYFVVLEPGDPTATRWTLEASIDPPAMRSPGDTCAAPVPLPWTDDGTGTLIAEATAALDTATLQSGTSCGGMATSARDVVFELDLPTARDVWLRTDSGGFHHTALQRECGILGSELRCRAGSSPQTQIFPALPAGRYYVALSTVVLTPEARVRVEARPLGSAPPNDRCDAAIPLAPGELARGSLSGLSDDVYACGASGMPDAFYTLALDERRRVTLVAASTAPSSPVTVAVRAGCEAGPSLACASDPGGAAALVRTLDPGTYVVSVEMPEASSGDFTIRAFLDPP